MKIRALGGGLFAPSIGVRVEAVPAATLGSLKVSARACEHSGPLPT